MKNFKIILAIAVVALMGTACEKSMSIESGERISVQYTVAVESVAGTRADYNAEYIDRLDYVVYRYDDATQTYVRTQVAEQALDIINGSANVSIDLLKGQKYKVTFFAYNSNSNKTDFWSYDTDKQIVSFDYAKMPCNSEQTDLFAGVATESETSVTLKRPLGLVNLYVTKADVDKATAVGVPSANLTAQVTLSNLACRYDLLNQTVLSESAYPSTTFELSSWTEGDPNYTIGSILVLAGQNIGLTMDKVTCNGFETIVENYAVSANIPTQANYRTNVTFEKLLTGSVEYNVTISSGFENNLDTTITNN